MFLPLPDSRGHRLCRSLLHLQRCQQHIFKSLSPFFSSCPLFSASIFTFPALTLTFLLFYYKDPCDYMESIQIILCNFPISKSLTLFAKFILHVGQHILRLWALEGGHYKKHLPHFWI